jgi:hypothetical protein
MTTTYTDRNVGSGMGQTHQHGMDKPVNGIQPLTDSIVIL